MTASTSEAFGLPPPSILRHLKVLAHSIVYHAAYDGIEVIVREKADFTFHIYLLLFDEGVIRII
jgi:hypothetical protein